MRRFLAFLLLATLAFAAEPTAKPHKSGPNPAALKRNIERLLKPADVARGYWGIEVVSLRTGKVLYSLNADRLFTPASNTKLFTTAAAFHYLGPDYRFRTTLETNGAGVIQPDGTLNGDLFLVGHGDPTISGRVYPYADKTERLPPYLKSLDDFAGELVRRGVKRIAGNLIADDTFFAYQRYGEGWSQDDLMWSDGAPAAALTVNDNTIYLTVNPGPAAGAPAVVAFEPDVPYYEVENRIVTTAGCDCMAKLGLDRQPGSMKLTLWGRMPLNARERGFGIAIEDPADYALRAFRAMLEQRGIAIGGRPRVAHLDPTTLPFLDESSSSATSNGKGGGADLPPSQSRTLLVTHVSPPLTEVAKVINKVSQNLHAENLLRTLASERSLTPSLESALSLEKDFLTEAGISPDDFAWFDGSGMSAQDLVSPHAVTGLLLYASHQPWADAYRATLPVMGVDGSLAERLKSSPAAGRVLGKTGTLGHVNALSGYATTLDGEPIAFSILSNHHKLTSRGAVKVIDQVILAIVDDAPQKKKNKKSELR